MDQSFFQDQEDTQFEYELRAREPIFQNRSILIDFDENLKEEIIFNDVFMGFDPQPDPLAPLELHESWVEIFKDFGTTNNIKSRLTESPLSPFTPHVNSTTLEADVSSSGDYASTSSLNSSKVFSVPNGLHKWLSLMMKKQNKNPKIVVTSSALKPHNSTNSMSNRTYSSSSNGNRLSKKRSTVTKIFGCCCADISWSSDSENEKLSPTQVSASWCTRYLTKSSDNNVTSINSIGECSGTTTVPNNSSTVSWFENNHWSRQLKCNPDQTKTGQSTTTQEPFTTSSTKLTTTASTIESLELLNYSPNQCCSQYRRCEYFGKNLLRCCEENDIETADFLIKAAHFCRGLLNFRQPGTNDTPLHVVIRCKSLHIFHLLMKYHEILNFGAMNADEATPLCLACSIPDIPLAIVGRLISHSKTFVTIPDHFLSSDPQQYMTPLQYAQVNNRTDIENLLVSFLQKHQNDEQ